MSNENDKKVSNENDKKSFWEELWEHLPGILLKFINSSAQSKATIAIAIGFSVTLSTVTIMYVPQVQEAILGPQGEPGPQGEQGIQGETGSPGISEVTQAELDELAIRINELRNIIFDMDDNLDDNLRIIDYMGAELHDLKTFSTPDYDSGWIKTNKGTDNVICRLDDINVFVYMIGKSSLGLVNQNYYGGYNRHPPYTVEMKMLGADWFITESRELRVYRYPEDTSYVEVRVLVWQLTS